MAKISKVETVDLLMIYTSFQAQNLAQNGTGVKRIIPDLEDDPDTSPSGYAKILRALAGQLGPLNDYYMPLMDVAKSLDSKNSRLAARTKTTDQRRSEPIRGM